ALRRTGGGDVREPAQNRDEHATSSASQGHGPMLGSPSLTIANCKQMTSRSTIILALITTLAVAGCGSAATDTAAPATANSDVNTLLQDTFRNAKQIKSADMSIKLSANGQGDSVSATLGGPYESQGEGKLPKFQWTASLNSGG